MLTLQTKHADTRLKHLEAHNELVFSTIQSQNRAGIDAVNNLQTTLKAIGATIERTVAAQPAYQALSHKEYLETVSSYHGELRHLNKTFRRLPVSKLSRVLSFEIESDKIVYLESQELWKQLKLWYAMMKFK